MKQRSWPPPEGWHEIVILWTTMLDRPGWSPRRIMWWCDENIQHRWHLHGYRSTEGFAFRFEDAKDAVLFALRWSSD